MHSIYLDHAAAAPLDPRVREAMEPFLNEEYGNPSSIHERGRRAKEAIENARKTVARILQCSPHEIVFTGSGTEANNLGIFGIARRYKKGHLITTAIEHHAVLRAMEALEKKGCEVTYLEVDQYGLIDSKKIKAALRPETILVSVMYANNEIGTIEPIVEVGKVIRDYRKEKLKIENWKLKIQEKTPFFLVDACQAAGYLDINVEKLGVDLMALNGSKIYGPKGIACLYVRNGVELTPIIYGGGQEKGLRSGTENVAGIVGFARALEIAYQEREKEGQRLAALRDYFIKEILQRLPGTVLNGHPSDRLPNNINISIPGIEGEAAVIYLDARGIQCSTGSACSAVSLEPSHVIAALAPLEARPDRVGTAVACGDLPLTGLGKSDEYTTGSLRFTLGRATTKGDIDYVMSVLPEIVKKLRGHGSSESEGFPPPAVQGRSIKSVVGCRG